MSETKEQIERNKILFLEYVKKHPSAKMMDITVDANSIKGIQVDDSEIGDGKTLTYSGVKDKIVYSRRHGGGGAVDLAVNPGFAVPVAVGTANATGVAATVVRSDHVHFGCRMATGKYTGDGSVGTNIAVGFSPKFVVVYPWSNVANTSFNFCDFKSDQDSGTLCFENYASDWKDDQVIALTSNGFTVDDAGADNHPNKNGQVYMYVAWG